MQDQANEPSGGTGAKEVRGPGVELHLLPNGLAGVTLISGNDTATFTDSGAHIWAVEINGKQLFFMSELTDVRAGAKFRGGVPLIGPVLGANLPTADETLKKDLIHGTDRRNPARLEILDRSADSPSVKYTIFSDGRLAAMGIASYTRERVYTLKDGIFRIDDTIINTDEERELIGTFGQHDYHKVSNIRFVGIRGDVEKMHVTDRPTGKELGQLYLPSGINFKDHNTVVDRLLSNPELAGERNYTIIDSSDGSMTFVKTSYPDAVVWQNPIRGAMPDMHEGGELQSVGLEPIGKVAIKPGGKVSKYVEYSVYKKTEMPPALV